MGKILRWTKGVLAPSRVGLCATGGAAGARAARILYRPYRRPHLSRVMTGLRSGAIASGLAPACRPPLTDFDDLCTLVGVAPEGAAAIHSWKTDRHILCLVAGDLEVVVKVGHLTDEGLSNETHLLQRLEGWAGSTRVPSVRWTGRWSDHLVLVTEVLPRARGRQQVTLDDALRVATELTIGAGPAGPLVHGDLAPWNLFRVRDGLGLVDWEHGRAERDPLYDLAHFVVAGSSLLGQHSPDEAIALLTSPGGPGWLHLSRVGVDPRDAAQMVEHYLLDTADRQDRGYRPAMLASLRGGRGGIAAAATARGVPAPADAPEARP